MDSATCTIALRVCVLYDDTERVSDLDRKFGVFSSSVFENRASLACLSGTELLFQLAGNTTSPTSTQDKHDLSAHDKAVRFLLWSEFMRIDAFISFSTRRVPTIDSNDCDRIVSSIGAHSIQERPLPVPSPRIHAIGMKNLWKNGPFHIMDQDIRRRTFETDWFAIRRESLDMSILVRKLMLENFDLNSQIQVCKVHDELIRWFHGFPQELKPFDTLQVFHEGYLTVNPLGRDVWRLSPASNLDVLLFLACLVRLHLPRMHSIEKCFSVGGEQCSSAKVIIVCFRALVYVILCLYTPIQVEPIVYPVPKPASPEAHDMPAPMLSNAMYAMPMYLVCGSAVLVSRIQEGETWDAQLGPIAEKVVVAALSKIVNIWPGCGEHLLNLQRLMADGDAEFWRKELQR